MKPSKNSPVNKKNQNAVDLSVVLAHHENKWVVLSRDSTRVIAAGNELTDVAASLSGGILLRVPAFGVAFIPHHCA